mmetsp:Transcript_6857/g.30912  ORF Transcript_6857/g.30912 Transcript_6857/m.30912 type:complete len:257 (-) Transcript_6857:743-1513(-)
MATGTMVTRTKMTRLGRATSRARTATATTGASARRGSTCTSPRRRRHAAGASSWTRRGPAPNGSRTHSRRRYPCGRRRYHARSRGAEASFHPPSMMMNPSTQNHLIDRRGEAARTSRSGSAITNATPSRPGCRTSRKTYTRSFTKRTSWTRWRRDSRSRCDASGCREKTSTVCRASITCRTWTSHPSSSSRRRSPCNGTGRGGRARAECRTRTYRAPGTTRNPGPRDSPRRCFGRTKRLFWAPTGPAGAPGLSTES